jgi:long-chain-fatty-acid--[acyl-carrier-protein] ligase
MRYGPICDNYGMMNSIRWVVWSLLYLILGMRYRVKKIGWEKVDPHKGPFLILPNHIAYSDPAIVTAYFWPGFQVRPVGLETNFNNPILKHFINLMRPVRIPAMESASKEARDRAVGAIQQIVDVLKAKENVLLWPSGRLTHDGLEKLGAARTAADVLAACPEVTVLKVRIRGLYGSSLSYAFNGGQPTLISGLLRGFGFLILNLFFFGPRRDLTIEIEASTAAERPEPTREKLNPWLEEWYNRPGAEQPTFVKNHWFLGPQSHEFPPMQQNEHVDTSAVPAKTKADVVAILEKKIKRTLSETEREPSIVLTDLGLDSIDAMDVSLQVEQRFGFQSADVPTTLGGLWALAGGLLTAAPPKRVPPEWKKPPSDTKPVEFLGETIPEALINRILRNPKDVAAADDLSGVITYEKLYVGVRTMAVRFRELEGQSVGLLLPASVAADVVYFALLIAGKRPVILNWTTGPTNLAHAAKITELKSVITSKAFIDRTNVVVEGTKYWFLEDIRKSIGKMELLKHLLTIRFFSSIAKRTTLKYAEQDPSKPAVVLFTSGSEKAPKAVPLSHANILSNQRDCSPMVKFTRKDTFIGFLPMFHSFGLTVTSTLPILAGMKVVHHPDPTDASALARKIATYQPNLIVTTPTFLGFIMERVKPGEWDHVRMVATAAEKCPDQIREKARKIAPHATVLEGYGITECTPAVAINPIDAVRVGTVGKIIPHVSAKILDPETQQQLPNGKMGMLHVRGPNVFSGYIGYDGPSPFKDIEGEKYYITGDLAELSDDGYLTFHGRMKRFLKVGGEMLSLPALEEPFAQAYPAGDHGPRVAVEGIEQGEGGRHVVLFTTESISLADANHLLHDNGFHGIMRLDEVRTISSIPVLGTGKTDYKQLRAMLTT